MPHVCLGHPTTKPRRRQPDQELRSRRDPLSLSDGSSSQFYGEAEEIKQYETEAYHQLVEAGGCPLYHIDQWEKVRNDLERHRELLLPWHCHSGDLVWDFPDATAQLASLSRVAEEQPR